MADVTPRIVSVTITLAAALGSVQTFNVPLIVGDQATGTTLGGDRVRVYTNNAALQDDSDVGTVPKAMGAAIFEQGGNIGSIVVGRVDTAGTSGPIETYSDAIDAIEAVNTSWATIIIESRADADIVSASANVELYQATNNRIVGFVAQSDDAGIPSGTFPAGMSAIENNQYTAIVYNTLDSELDDARAVGRALGKADLDDQSVVWNGTLQGGLQYTLTDAQITAIQGININMVQPALDQSRWLFGAGMAFTSLDGRPFDQIYSAAWVKARSQEAAGQVFLNYDQRGEKIPLNPIGQAVFNTEFTAVLQRGQNAGHVDPTTDAIVTSLPITTADRAANRARYESAPVALRGITNIQYDVRFQNV